MSISSSNCDRYIANEQPHKATMGYVSAWCRWGEIPGARCCDCHVANGNNPHPYPLNRNQSRHVKVNNQSINQHKLEKSSEVDKCFKCRHHAFWEIKSKMSIHSADRQVKLWNICSTWWRGDPRNISWACICTRQSIISAESNGYGNYSSPSIDFQELSFTSENIMEADIGTKRKAVNICFGYMYVSSVSSGSLYYFKQSQTKFYSRRL